MQRPASGVDVETVRRDADLGDRGAKFAENPAAQGTDKLLSFSLWKFGGVDASYRVKRLAIPGTPT
jgi:hypothetical protein